MAEALQCSRDPGDPGSREISRMQRGGSGRQEYEQDQNLPSQAQVQV